MRLHEKTWKWALCLIITMLIVMPYIITISYSLVSADDFSMAVEGKGIDGAVETAKRFYATWSGGIPFIFLQVLLNPLHYGHSYSTPVGIILIIFLVLFLLCMYLLTRIVMSNIFGEKQTLFTYCFFLIILFAVLNSEVYPEIYYWFVGNSYLWGLIIIMVDIICTIQYFKSKFNWFRCIGLSLLGFIACFFYQYAILAGLSYMFIWYLNLEKRNVRKFKYLVYSFLPLLFMILGGCISVFAPGNFARYNFSTSSNINIMSAIGFAFRDIAKCIKDLVKSPICTMSMCIFFFCGTKFATKQRTIKPIIVWVLASLAIYGIVFPLALGYSNWYVPNRQQFVISTPMILIGGFCLFYTGSYYQDKIKTSKVLKQGAAAVSILLLCVSIILCRFNFAQIPWIKTVVSIPKIVEENQFYNKILYDIETSDEQNVVIHISKNAIPPASGIIKEPFNIYDNNDWINEALCKWYRKDTIRCEIK